MCTVFPTNKTIHAIHPNETNCPHTIYPNDINRPCVIYPNEMRRGGACVPARTSAQRRFHTKNTCIVRGEWMMDAPLQGDTGGHTGTAPTHLRNIFPRNPTQTKPPTRNPPKRHQPPTRNPPNDINHPTRNLPKRHQPPTCNPLLPISTKLCGVPLPHRGYTFDSAGLASATQPTLGNSVREEATPLGVVLFLITHHHHTRRMNDLPHAN